MARRDVDLVIRARDEAKRTLDAITEALNDFVGAQDQLAPKAAKTDSTLQRLGKSLETLEAAFAGLGSVNALQDDLARAQTAFARLEASLSETAADADRYAKAAVEAAAATEKLSAEATRADAALARQRAAVKGISQEQTKLNSALAKASADRERLVTADAKLTGQIDKQVAKVTEAEQRYKGLSAEITRTVEPTKRLQTSFAASERSLAANSSRLEELRTTQGAVRNAIGQTSDTISRLSNRLTDSNRSFEQQSSILKRTAQTQSELSVSVRNAAQSQGKLETEARKSAQALSSQQAAFARASTNLEQLSAAAAQADAAIGQFAASTGSELQRALDLQRRATLEAKRAWSEATAEVKRMAEALRTADEPTEEMAAAFDKAHRAASTAKKEFQAQRGALQAMTQATQQSGNSVEQLAARQQRFVQIQAQTGVAISKLQGDAKRAESAQRGLANETDRASAGQERLQRAVRSSAGAMQQGAASTNAFAAAVRRFYGESRTALSFTQRLRGEVLALTASYVGFFAAIQGVQNVVSAFQSLEAAQSRLNVVFDSDQTAIGQELDFIRRNADRLGIQFGVLAQEYTKFAVATKGTNLEGDRTRQIFIATAEAGRVNKLALDQLKGVFVALAQIASKGAVQMEELRQQLGDRLPGALQIMADGLGVGTDELIKMMEQGEVSSEALVGFAEELTRRFGGALPAALQTTTAEMGRLQNTAFQALLAIANSGFIESFTALVRDLNEALASADAAATFQSIGAALGTLTEVLGAAVQNFSLLTGAGTAFVALKLSGFVVAFASALGIASTSAVSFRRVLVATVGTMQAASTAAGAAAAALRGLALAARLLLSSTGIGFLVTAIGFGIGLWATTADEATEALVAHRKVVDELKNAYDKVGGSVKTWGEEVNKISVTQAQARLRQFEAQLQDVVREIGGILSVGGRGAAVVSPFRDVFRDFVDGEIRAGELKVRFDELSQAGGAIGEKASEALQDLADELIDIQGKTDEARDVLLALTGTAVEQADAMRRLRGEIGDTADANLQAKTRAEAFRNALRDIGKVVPELAAEFDRLNDKIALDEAFEAANRAAAGMDDLLLAAERYGQALDALGAKNVDEILGGSGTSFADKILQIEGVGRGGGTSSAQDVGVLGGFIRSTWLDLFREHFPDRAEAMTDEAILLLRQNERIVREMIELLARENAKVLQAAGVAINEVSLQLAHFLGPNGAVKVLQAPGNTPLTDLLGADQIAANQSVLGGGRTAADLIEFSKKKLGITQDEFAVQSEIASIEKRRADQATEFHKQEREAAEARAFEIENARETGLQAEINKAIFEAQTKAKQAGTKLTEAELELIKQQTTALFEQEEARNAKKKALEAAQKAEAEVNNLLEIRRALQEQLVLAGADNDFGQTAVLNEQIKAINDQLREAIENAIKFWGAIGGTESDAAIIKLQTLGLTLKDQANRVVIDWKRVQNLFATGLVDAFNSFSDAINSGEKAGKAAADAFRQFAADFLRQIAQMILQQLALNAARAISGGIGIPVAHQGWVVGRRPSQTRRVDPGIFANAMRYHGGGLPGLNRGEHAAILQEGEEVLDRGDSRNILNGGGRSGGGGGNRMPRIINAIDRSSLMQEALSTPDGEEAIINMIEANPSRVRAALGL